MQRTNIGQAHIKAKVKEENSLLATVDERLALLLAKRQALRTYISDQQTLLSPIRRLSIEILQCIFLHTLPEHRSANMSPAESPLLVSQICSRWREAALSAPYLWSTLHIPAIRAPQPIINPWIHQRSTHHLLCGQKMVQLWLERAGQTDLSISIGDGISAEHARRPQTGGSPTSSCEIILLLIKHASQWVKLEIGIHYDVVFPLLAVTAEQAPKIRSLRLHHQSCFETKLAFERSILKNAPSLTSFHLYLNRYTGDIPTYRWSALTDISVTMDWSNAQIAHFLTLCPSVVTLSLAVRYNYSIDQTDQPLPPSQEDISLPHLKTFLFCSNTGRSYQGLFNYVSLPSLDHLVVRCTPPRPLVLVGEPEIMGLIARWGNQLKKMEIYTVSFSPAYRPEACLKYTPELESLILHCPSISDWTGTRPDDRFWKALCVPLGTPQTSQPSSELPLLPKLTSFVCHGCMAFDFGPAGIQDLLRSRCQNADNLAPIGVRRLQHFHIFRQFMVQRNVAAHLYSFHPEDQDDYQARDAASKRLHMEFLEELSALPGVDIEGVDIRIKWLIPPNVGDEKNSPLSPWYGLPSFKDLF